MKYEELNGEQRKKVEDKIDELTKSIREIRDNSSIKYSFSIELEDFTPYGSIYFNLNSVHFSHDELYKLRDKIVCVSNFGNSEVRLLIVEKY